MRLSILVRIGRAIASNLELEPLLETIHAELSRLFDTLNFFIVVWPVDSPEFTFALHYEQGVRQAAMRRGVDQGLTGCILRTGRSLSFSSVQEKQAFFEREGIRSGGRPSRSWMGVPLVTRDRVVGAMVIQDYEKEGAYTPSDLDLFSAIAAPLAVAVQNAQLYEAAQRRAREMETLARIGRDLTSTLDADQVLRRITDSVRELLTHDSVAIFYRSEREEDFRAIATTGRIAGPLQSLVVRPGIGILGSIAVSGAAEIVSDTSRDARAIHIPGTEHSRQGEKLMAAPLVSQRRVVGLIAAWRGPQETPFEASELSFLEGIALQASVAIRNAQLFGQAKAALAEAETASRAKSSFLANMSHELRTPLNAILLYSELLQDEALECGLGELNPDLERIQGSGRHLLSLIDDILDLSRIEAGRMTVFPEVCELSTLLDELSAAVQPLCARNRNRFRMELEPGLRNLVTDYRKLRQTLYNLLSNAAKFTQDGQVELTIKSLPGTVPKVCFVVADTGIGMSPEQLERVFQEFAQAEESTAREFGGTGLGLTLAKRFVELLAGELRVESLPGKGSRFTVLLPATGPPVDGASY
jgi:signal transduction histidine kinase